MPRNTTEITDSDRLEEILEHLRRMDKRDRLRTWGGFMRSLISLIPLIIFLWSIWYFSTHTEEILKMISEQAAKSAAGVVQNGWLQ